MLPPDRLQLAIDIQFRSYKLLRWVADAIGKGFIPATRAHEYADVTDSAYEWIEEHYQNLPANARPERGLLRPFASFFATYMMSSFDIIEQPGMRLESPCGCYCKFCSYVVRAPHLQTKRLTKRDKQRALRLMADRVQQLAIEAGIAAAPELAERIATDELNRRSAGNNASSPMRILARSMTVWEWVAKRRNGIVHCCGWLYGRLLHHSHPRCPNLTLNSPHPKMPPPALCLCELGKLTLARPG